MTSKSHSFATPLSRRRLLAAGASLAAAAALPSAASRAASQDAGLRAIPASGEEIPAVGLGTWITFNVGRDPKLRDARAEVMKAFFAAGGRVIDSSPMYGSSQAVIGHGLEKLGAPTGLFAADKVWTSSAEEGPRQIEDSRRLWGVRRFDLLQVHNLVAWEEQLPLLFRMKEEGRLRYAGVTTSHGRRHGELLRIMESQPLDFVQLTYNPLDREAEDRLLPLAREKGIAVIVNRPFRRGALTERLEREPLPDWAAEIQAATWAQAILKFIISHPTVTVAIPATTQPRHAEENVAASRGPMPDEALRERIAAYIRSL